MSAAPKFHPNVADQLERLRQVAEQLSLLSLPIVLPPTMAVDLDAAAPHSAETARRRRPHFRRHSHRAGRSA
jgi:hypothetical protein